MIMVMMMVMMMTIGDDDEWEQHLVWQWSGSAGAWCPFRTDQISPQPRHPHTSLQPKPHISNFNPFFNPVFASDLRFGGIFGHRHSGCFLLHFRIESDFSQAQGSPGTYPTREPVWKRPPPRPPLPPPPPPPLLPPPRPPVTSIRVCQPFNRLKV